MNFILPPADAIRVSGGTNTTAWCPRTFAAPSAESRSESISRARITMRFYDETRWPLGRNWPSCHSKVITAGTLRRAPITELCQDS